MGGASPRWRMGECWNRHQCARTLRRFVASAGRKIYQSSLISGGGAAAKASCHPCRISWKLDPRRRGAAWRRTMRWRCLPAPKGWGIGCRRRWRMYFGRVLPDRHDEYRGAHETPQDEVLRRGGGGYVHAPLQPCQRGLHTDAIAASSTSRERTAHGISRRLD